MRLTAEQLEMLRKSFEKVGALKGRSEEEITRLMENVAELYLTLMNINLKKRANECPTEPNKHGNKN